MGNAAVLLEETTLVDALLSAARSAGMRLRPTRLEPLQVSSIKSGLDGCLHALTEGHLKLVRYSSEGRALILELLDAGDVFGEVDVVLDAEEQPTYVEALTPARFESLPAVELERVLCTRSALALALARRMGERRRRIERRLEAQIFQNVQTRLANELRELASRYGELDPEGIRIGIRLSQQDLGGLIGASREIVSLTLTQFRKLGAVTSKRRRLVIRDAELARIAEGARLG